MNYYIVMALGKKNKIHIYHGAFNFCGVTRFSLSPPSFQPFFPNLGFCSDLGLISAHLSSGAQLRPTNEVVMV